VSPNYPGFFFSHLSWPKLETSSETLPCLLLHVGFAKRDPKPPSRTRNYSYFSSSQDENCTPSSRMFLPFPPPQDQHRNPFFFPKTPSPPWQDPCTLLLVRDDFGWPSAPDSPVQLQIFSDGPLFPLSLLSKDRVSPFSVFFLLHTSRRKKSEARLSRTSLPFPARKPFTPNPS